MFDLDHFRIDIECPNCRFTDKVSFRDARLRKILICRGCKSSIQLDDRMNQCRKARKQISRATRELEEALSGFNATITLRL